MSPTNIIRDHRYQLLFRRLGIVLVLYLIFRIVFLIFNANFFDGIPFSEHLAAFIYGIRFDIAAIAITNSIVILLHLLPVNGFYSAKYQRILKWVFIISNIPAIILNFIDVAFYQFQGKRSTADLFEIITTGDEVTATFWSMVVDFWYAPVFILISILLLSRMYPLWRGSISESRSSTKISYIVLIIGIGVIIIAARGGLQYKPLRILSAAGHGNPRLANLVLNSTFTTIKTIGKPSIQKVAYMDTKEAEQHFNKIHQFQTNELKNYNVVLIILESFSAEYIGFLNSGKGYTPVLDSIAAHSLVFNNGIANAKRSIDGLPAITSSLPGLMPESFITSKYNGNRIEGIASYLSSKDYVSSFFHGGNNGTMGFDNFTSMTGFTNYYGMDECSSCRSDGKWGIYDEDFYNFMLEVTDKTSEPFFNCFFSLSSHHPYKIPSEHSGKFPVGNMDIHESIGYADYSLGKFFEMASKKPWFRNTLFVITADHTGPSIEKSYMNSIGNYRIPVIYHMPGVIEPGVKNFITQQSDILPSVLDLIGYDQSFTAFGKSVFVKSTNRFSVNFTGDIYQCINDKYLLQFDGEEVVGLYDHKKDALFSTNLFDRENTEHIELEMQLKSYLQQFNQSMVNNQW